MTNKDVYIVIEKMRNRINVAKQVRTNPIEIGIADLELLLDHLESALSFVRDFEELEALDGKEID